MNKLKKILQSIRYFLAKVCLKLFKSEYKLLRGRFEIKTQRQQFVSGEIDEVVMKDKKWHFISLQVNFWAKKGERARMFFDGLQINNNKWNFDNPVEKSP